MRDNVVGLTSLVAAVIVIFFGDGWLRGKDEPPPTHSTEPAAPATATGPAPATPATASEAPPSTPTPSPEPTVQWTGVVRLGSGVDLDKVPPTIRTSEENTDISESSSFFVRSIKAQEQSLAPWDDSATPTRQQCIETLSTQGTTEWGASGKEDVEDDALFCLRTSEGRIAVMKIKKSTYHKMQATVKVWDSIESL